MFMFLTLLFSNFLQVRVWDILYWPMLSVLDQDII